MDALRVILDYGLEKVKTSFAFSLTLYYFCHDNS